MVEKTVRPGGVYRITNMQNGKIYIGSAVRFDKRWYEHRRLMIAGRHKNRHLQAAWDKYGAGAFVFETLEVLGLLGTKAEVKAALIAAEQRHIDVLNACDSAIGYNINVVATSRLGVKASPETRARIGASKKGKTFHLGIPHSAETKELLRQQATGKTWTPEMRANFVMSRKGRPHSEEHSANLRASLRRLHKSDERDARKAQEKAERDLTPKRLSDEHRANISKALKGRSKRPFSAQHRAAIAAARTGKSSKAPVGQVSLW